MWLIWLTKKKLNYHWTHAGNLRLEHISCRAQLSEIIYHDVCSTTDRHYIPWRVQYNRPALYTMTCAVQQTHTIYNMTCAVQQNDTIYTMTCTVQQTDTIIYTMAFAVQQSDTIYTMTYVCSLKTKTIVLSYITLDWIPCSEFEGSSLFNSHAHFSLKIQIKWVFNPSFARMNKYW